VGRRLVVVVDRVCRDLLARLLVVAGVGSISVERRRETAFDLFYIVHLQDAHGGDGMPTRVADIVNLALDELACSQLADGSWGDLCEMGIMPDAQTAIFTKLLQVDDPQWIDGLVRRIRATQGGDGGWSTHPCAAGDLSTTVECAYALELHQAWADQTARERAWQFVQLHGGIHRCRNLTRVILAIGGELPWSTLPSSRLYAWLFARRAPIPIERMSVFTRLHVAPILLIADERFTLASGGVFSPRFGQGCPAADVAQASERRPVCRWPSGHGRRMDRCHDYVMAQQESDGSLAGYHSSTFLLICARLARGARLDDPAIARQIRAVRNNWQPDADGRWVQQTCDSRVWNTALATQALTASGSARHASRIAAARCWIWDHQQRCGCVARDVQVRSGGWGFSANNTRHPDTDDTIACLTAVAPAGEARRAAWQGGLAWLTSMQNADGGFAAFDRGVTRNWLDHIPANDMAQAISDVSTPDVTARALEFLVAVARLQSGDRCVRRARQRLLRMQERDGSFYGRWGNTYIYGTWCALRALSCFADATAAVERACRWLLSVQLPDGAFGEAHTSDMSRHFCPRACGLLTQTAWALDGLVAAATGACARELGHELRQDLLRASGRAARWLCDCGPATRWRESVPTGSAFAGALYIRYHIYPKVWPLIALCRYRELCGSSLERG
jgi:sporulenol synthase